jgi:hypothetical protein
LSQRKGARQRNKPPVIKQIENPTPKQVSWWATELIPEPEDNILKWSHHTKGGADQAAALKRQKKKRKQTKHYPTTWQDYNRASA